MSSPVGKDSRQTRGFYVMPFHEKMDYKFQRRPAVPFARVAWCWKYANKHKEYFNMKHSSTRNVIERAFGVLKGRWAILHGKSYYPLQVQCRTILDYIHYIETTNEWSQWCGELAESMFTDWQLCNA
ncbi:retrotransposon protein [Cucumis melo var. makuwa]|uniref:Retrotransposon protein n=1 Tax=Cucumis melo var. makuwa TaxID=1194695 RepID=A0A5A7SQG2_CUCMM|nr:retrotransposon protein [Cucumis melo var. makuwa]